MEKPSVPLRAFSVFLRVIYSFTESHRAISQRFTEKNPDCCRTFRNSIVSLILLIFSQLSQQMNAQDLGNIGKTPLLTANGGVSFNQVFFDSNDSLSLRDPYAYTFMANLNVSVYGWSVPLSVLYSNRQWSYQQPFNQFSLHPSYKWVKAHIGNVSMNFSPYTLSGHQFMGGGAELTPPGKFKFSVMAGQLQKRVLPDSSGFGEPAYKRFGSGIKAEYTNPIGNVGASIFYASDETKSLVENDSALTIFPTENFAMSLSGNVTLFQNLSISAEYSVSTLTDNKYSPENKSTYPVLPFYKRRESTHQYHALKSAINYNSKLGSAGVAIERVDPGYRTLGAYYNSNDFVNYTLNYAGGILKNKLTLAVSYGLQQDNLNGDKAQDNKRTVGNLNIGFAPVERLNFAMFYSNFNNYTHIKTNFENINNTSPYGNLDTLDFTQVSENVGLSADYSFGNKEKISHNLNISVNYQQADQNQSDNPTHAGSSFYTGVGGYNLKINAIDLSPGVMMNYSRSKMDSLITDMVGPSLSLRKGFLEHKLNVSAMLSYNTSLMNGLKQGDNTMLRISTGYTIQKKHALDLSFVNAWRNNQRTGHKRETTVTFTYRYNFSWEPGGDTKQKENEAK